jgi:hypothetical protein
MWRFPAEVLLIPTLGIMAPLGSALTGVSGGSYTVTVTDANGCIDSSTVTITEPSQAFSVVTTSTTALTCNGDANASITVNTSGAQGATYL